MIGPLSLDVMVTVGYEPGMKLGTLEVPDAEVTEDAIKLALAKFLRLAADRIEPKEAGCDHPRLVPRLPCAECDPRDPLEARFG